MRKIRPPKRKDQLKNLKMFQARVDKNLYQRLRARLTRDGVYVQDFLTSAIETYLKG